jgi:hypothetical protein
MAHMHVLAATALLEAPLEGLRTTKQDKVRTIHAVLEG